MKKILLFFMLIATAICAMGQAGKPTLPNAMVGDIFYIFDASTKTATVGCAVYWAVPPTPYSGNVVIPSTVEYENQTYTVDKIAMYAFCDYNEELTSVTIPTSVTTLDESAFDGTVITTLDVPNSVQTIGATCFQYSYLKSITLGSGLQSIGANAFSACTSLTEVTIKAVTPPTITANTFPAAVKAKITLTVPKGSLSAYQNDANWGGFMAYKEADGGGTGGGGTGGGSDDPSKVEINGVFYELTPSTSSAVVISGYQAGITETPYSGVVNVPSTVNYNGATYTVTGVASRAFEYATCTSVTLPSTCTTLGAYSFDSMSALTYLDLGGTQDIPGNGITGCPVLKDLYLGYSGGVVGTVGASIQASMKANLNIHVPSALLNAYSSSSFWNAMCAILIPNQVQIGDLYYEYYDDKTAMVLAPYVIPGNGTPKNIGPSVEVPGSITVDGQEYTVTNLQAGVFYDTPNVSSITFNEGLKNVEFETFYGTKVTEVVFPNSLENLEYNNFYACLSLTKVTFGSGFKTLGHNQFYYCPNVTEITVLATEPPVQQPGSTGSVFNSTFNKANVILYVPAGTVDAYRNSTIWAGFKEYKEIGGGSTSDPSNVEINGIFYQLTPANSTAIVINGYKAGITETPYSGVVNVPSTVNYNGTTYTVTGVAASAFEYATCTSVTLPSTCTTLGAYSFDSMSALTYLDLGGTQDIPGNGITGCPMLKDLYLGYSGGVVGTVGASIQTSMKANLNIHVPSALLDAYSSSSFWNAMCAILIPNQVQIGDLYYEYYDDKTAMVLAPYVIPGNGTPKNIGPSVEVPGSITVDGQEYTVTNLQAGVFYDTPNVSSITFNEGLKNVEFETFYGTKVTEVVFPNSLENLEYNNFYACLSLTKVTFGSGFKTLGHNQFYYCPNVTEITVLATEPPVQQPGSTGSVFNSTFNKANVTLYVPAGTANAYRSSTIWSGFKEYKEIGGGEQPSETHVKVDGVWYDLTENVYADEEGVLECYVAAPIENSDPAGDEYTGKVTIPGFITYKDQKYAVTRIGRQAFYMQENLTEVEMPSTVKIINTQAFQASGIKTATIPENVLRIDNYAFFRCSSLESMITLGRTPATATSQSFQGITTNCKLFVPRGCVNTYQAAAGWKDFASIEEDPNSPVVPTSISIQGMPRTMLIGDTARLTAVVLPYDATDKSVEWKSLTPEVAEVDSTGLVTAIGSGNALIEAICNGNRAISINASVVCVTAQAQIDGISYRFVLNEQERINDAYVIRPASSTYAGDVVIPSQVQHGSTFKVRGIDGNAFALMENVTSVTIPYTVDTIGFNAFRLCSGLKRVNITNLTSWANINFRDQLATPFNVAGVAMYLNGQEVTDVRISGNITTIKPFVFQGIGSIKTLVIEDGVRQIMQNAFKDCIGLESVVIANSVDSIGLSVFSGCSALSSIQLPSSLRVIAGGTFANSGLKNIVIPDNVTLIDNQAFQNCAQLKTIVMGSKLQQLNLLVFDGCTALDTITVNAVVPPAFFQVAQTLAYFPSSIYPTCVLLVPDNSVDAYKNADIWKNFANIRGINSNKSETAVIDGISYELFTEAGTAMVLPSASYTDEITIPATVSYNGKEYAVTEIAPRAFAGTGIDILRLPANIKHIPEEMAANCLNLVSVGLPDHLETIGVRAFYGSPNIRFIRSVNYGVNNNLIPPTFTETDDSSYGNAFSESIWPDCMLCIPSSMYMNYKKSNGWSNFRTYAYWHVGTDVEPESVEFPGEHKFKEGSTTQLAPYSTPENATILNFVVRNSNPDVVTISAGKDENNKPVLVINNLKKGKATITVYMNLVKTSFDIEVVIDGGVEGIENDDTTPARYFNMQGIEVANPQPGAIYVKVQGNKAERIVYRQN